MPTLFQHLAAHVRLTLAFGAGAVVAAAWPGGMDPVTRALIGWNVGTWLYLAVVAWKIEHADHAHVRRVAEAQAESIAPDSILQQILEKTPERLETARV